jgi:hypothetical protein
VEEPVEVPDDEEVLDVVEPLEDDDAEVLVPVEPPEPVVWFEEQARREIAADASNVAAVVLCMCVTQGEKVRSVA